MSLIPVRVKCRHCEGKLEIIRLGNYIWLECKECGDRSKMISIETVW